MNRDRSGEPIDELELGHVEHVSERALRQARAMLELRGFDRYHPDPIPKMRRTGMRAHMRARRMALARDRWRDAQR